MLDVKKDELNKVIEASTFTAVDQEVLASYITNCNKLHLPLVESHYLMKILDAYNNILIGRRGKEGIWKFENEEVGPYRVTISKPSPRDLPNVTIVSIESKEAIPLSLLVDRTRGKLAETLSEVEEPIAQAIKQLRFATISGEYAEFMRKVMNKVESQDHDVRLANDECAKQRRLAASVENRCVVLKKEKNEMKQMLRLSLFGNVLFALCIAIMTYLAYQT